MNAIYDMTSPQSNGVTIVPLNYIDWGFENRLPFDLGSGFFIRDVSSLLHDINISLWTKFVSENEREEVRGWTVCLVHEFLTTLETRMKDGEDSGVLCRYVIAHLWMLLPNKTNGHQLLRGFLKDGRLDATTLTLRGGPILLEDCEFYAGGIQMSHLEELRKLIPWILKFRQSHLTYYSLYLSLFLSEKAYLEETLEIKHLLRSAALEALVSDEKVFGKKALKARIPKLVCDSADLYKQYDANTPRRLPTMRLLDVLDNVCELRNKIAHGHRPPAEWFTRDRRPGDGGALSYVDELREAATAILRLVWLKILREDLMETIADKAKMRAYLERDRLAT